MSARLKRALKQRLKAERRVIDVLKTDYPPGSTIAWEGSDPDDIRRGLVTMNCYDDRIKVRNVRTGCELFIHAYRIRP